MSTQLILAISCFVFSILLLPVFAAVLSRKDPTLRKYMLLCTIFYISGTVLVLIISVIKPEIPLLWSILCEICALGIYAVSCFMIFFIVKKFAEGANPPANQKPDDNNDIDLLDKFDKFDKFDKPQ